MRVSDEAQKMSPLRQLASEHFVGALDREHYVARRHQVISALQLESDSQVPLEAVSPESKGSIDNGAGNELEHVERNTAQFDDGTSKKHLAQSGDSTAPAGSPEPHQVEDLEPLSTPANRTSHLSDPERPWNGPGAGHRFSSRPLLIGFLFILLMVFIGSVI